MECLRRLTTWFGNALSLLMLKWKCAILFSRLFQDVCETEECSFQLVDGEEPIQALTCVYYSIAGEGFLKFIVVGPSRSLPICETLQLKFSNFAKPPTASLKKSFTSWFSIVLMENSRR